MAEIILVRPPVHHGRVENYGPARARHGVSRTYFNHLLATMDGKSKLEIVAHGAVGYIGAKAISQYADEAGWLTKFGIESQNLNFGRAAICGGLAYVLRNRQPIMAVGAGIAAVEQVVGTWVDTAIHGFAHPELSQQQNPAGQLPG